MISTSSVSHDGREDVLKFISSIILFRRKRNADAKAAKRRQKVRAMKAEKPKQKHRERKPKAEGEEQDGDGDEDEDDDEFNAPTQLVDKKKQLSMQELIAKELADIERERT